MTSDKVLAEAERLYNLGWAIHWLHPKSKRPIESGWTKGPRKTWKALKESYRQGMNVGVRLGVASKVGDEFLAVVDVDIKSSDPKHAEEVKAKLKALMNGHILPQVQSGRGNGSRHYYILTPKPVLPFKAFQSTETVKVSMPSVTPSKRELASLTAKEIAAGVRLRAPWEIGVMGEGQQVVLPPSTHPDSGKAYQWVEAFKPALALDFDHSILERPADVHKPVHKPGSIIPPKGIGKAGGVKIDIEEVEISWLPISDKIKAMILTGEGVEDRSAMLLPVASALLRSGLTRNEILSVLTDPETFLGQCAYDHAKTKDRMKAAAWVFNYTLARVEKDNSSEQMFREPLTDAPPKLVGAEEQAEMFDDMEELTPAGGFHFVGAKGGLVPDYAALLAHFEKNHPFKTIADMKAVYVFNGTHYQDFTPVEIKGFAEDSFRPKPTEKTRLEFVNKVLANNIQRRSFFTTSTENKINFKNGVLSLDDGGFMGPQLAPHSPEYGFRGVLPYDFNPKAECPFFDKWISGIMLGDEDLVAVLQEFMGYIVRGGDYKYHKALWLGGTGRNGKSTFIDLLKALIGAGNFSTISIKSLMSDKFAGADLDGKTANFSEETSPQELADSGPFKNLTGDGEIFAQKKYGDPYSFRNRAKLIMTYNTIPDLKDLSAGMLSRPIIIPFRKVIKDEDQDRGIKQKLFKELPGIFNFAMAGWERLEEQNDFTRSELSANALKRVREESCNVFQWVEHHIVFSPNYLNESDSEGIAPRELYAAYALKERYPFKAVEFFRRLNAHPKMKIRRRRNMTKRYYIGLEIER